MVMNSRDVPLITLTYAPKKKSPSLTEWCSSCFCPTLVLICVLTVLSSLVMLLIDARDPRVALESISISLQDGDGFANGTTAKWDVAVSIENRNTMSYLQFGEFSVWVSCMWESSSQAAIPGVKLVAGDTFFVNGTVTSSLTDHARSQLVHGSVVDVLLKAECSHPYLSKRTVKVACRDIGVGVLSGATRERKYCTALEGLYPFDVDKSGERGGPIIVVRPGRRVISSVATIDLESGQKINN